MYGYELYATPVDAIPRMTSMLVDGPTGPVLTLAQAKLRAGFNFADGDERDELLNEFVAAATNKVQLDTSFALIEQTRDVLIYSATLPTTICLPAQSRPLQSVEAITYTADDGSTATVDPETYAVDLGSACITTLSGWPTNADAFGLWTVRIVAGWPDATAMPPLLVQAVGILTAHLATTGRDMLGLADQLAELPYAYDDCIAQYRAVRAS